VDSRKVFAEDFRKEIFFVLVCGPFLLIENFLAAAKPPAVQSLLRRENERFLTAKHLIFTPSS
jgi:hypothetical protein